jgi:Spy/CpxP family protein refolding chaperone
VRKSVVLVVLLTVAVSPAHAQRPVADRAPAAAPEQILEFLVSRLYRGISLTKEQTAKVKEIIDKSLAEQQALDFGAIDFREKRAAILDRRNSAFRAILSSDSEKAKFDTNLKSM